MPPQASVATENQSRPRSSTLSEGGIISGGHLHHPGGHHDEEGVVHPRGWCYVPVAMCFISLSRVLDLAWSWCTASFVTIVGSYGVSPSLSSCDELSFTSEVSLLSDWILLWIWEHLIYVLHMNTRGDNGVLYWFTWYMFWQSTHGFPRWHWGNLCIGVDARFRPTLSDRNFGVILCCTLRDCYMIQLCYHCRENLICLAYEYPWWQWVIILIHLIYV